MEQLRNGVSTMKNTFFLTFLCCSVSIAQAAPSRCDDSLLNGICKHLFKRKYASECRGETLQLFPKCLFMASECKRNGQITDTSYIHSANVNYSKAYDRLIKNVKIYRRCFARSSMQCNESMIQNCYVNFEQNSSKTCQNVHKLRFCILILRPKGCHEMRNPWHTLAIGIIKSYKSCFIQNYTILLETLDQKRKVPTTNLRNRATNITRVLPCTFKKNFGPSYTFVGAILFFGVVIIFGLTLLVFIKRYGFPFMERWSLSGTGYPCDSIPSSVARPSRISIAANGLTSMTSVDEEPPPYCEETLGMFPGSDEFPPPYSSQPTSLNGYFV